MCMYIVVKKKTLFKIWLTSREIQDFFQKKETEHSQEHGFHDFVRCKVETLVPKSSYKQRPFLRSFPTQQQSSPRRKVEYLLSPSPSSPTFARILVEIDSRWKREGGIVARRVAAAAAKDTREYRKRFPLHSSCTRPVSVFRDTREIDAWEGSSSVYVAVVEHDGKRWGIDRGGLAVSGELARIARPTRLHVLTRDYKFASRLPRRICTRAKLCAYRP